MAVLKDAAIAEKEVPLRSRLDRLNEYGERHATAIIAVSTSLIILTVLIFAKHFYDKSQVERAGQELAQAESVDRLKELKQKFGATPIAPRILFRLANKYYEEGRLEVARNEYKEFQSRFPADPLGPQVLRAINSIERNVRFETEQKEARLKEIRLLPHPRQMAETKDIRFQWGPTQIVRPTAEIALPGGTVKIELFEDDAPNAVAAFVKLAEQKYFDGVKWDIMNGDERVQTRARTENGQDLPLAVEDSKRVGEAGSLLLVEKNGARFQILLRSLPEIKEATIFGMVTEGLPLIKSVKKDEAITSVKILSKRDHPYEPVLLKKP
jgi:peptidyl-prolyl cis-trans isomerase B (cyclophilin B)